MKEIEARSKLCPLRQDQYCQTERCMWWTDNHNDDGECAITKIADKK